MAVARETKQGKGQEQGHDQDHWRCQGQGMAEGHGKGQVQGQNQNHWGWAKCKGLT